MGQPTTQVKPSASPASGRRSQPQLLLEQDWWCRGDADQLAARERQSRATGVRRDLEEAGQGVTSSDERATNLFYAHYYLGKYYEIMDQDERALEHVQTALKYPIQHFMYACALADAKRLKPSNADEVD